ncbi:DUF6207 family protein [Streptomyces microflavus]|uniref:DUF6207 family protein n=1 Tax=Streptomyces microflavus TaxID=1919 RepID=UPI003B224AB8
MDSVIAARHVSEPGLVALGITAADEESALALMDGLQQLWAASGITEIRATPPTPPPASASARWSGSSPRCGSPPRPRGCSGELSGSFEADAVLPANARVLHSPGNALGAGGGPPTPTWGCSAAREAVVPALAVVPADTAPSRSRSDPPARRRHGPTVRGACTPCRSKSGPYADQPPTAWPHGGRFRWSGAMGGVYHQQTKNLLVSYSPKKLGFF